MTEGSTAADAPPRTGPEAEPRPARAVARSRWSTFVWLLATTPAWLALLIVLVIGLGVSWGVAVPTLTSSRTTAAQDVSTRSEPLAVDAEELYRSLADADASAASAALDGSLPDAVSRPDVRYQDDIARAGQTLAVVAGATGASPRALADITTLTSEIPVYTGRIERARIYDLLGYPVAIADLRLASSDVMNRLLLPAAADFYQIQTAALDQEARSASSTPVTILGLGAAYVLLLVGTLLFLGRRTHRRLDVAVILAIAGATASVVWAAVAFTDETTAMVRSQADGSAPVVAFAQVRITALQAHANESLSLVSRGEDAITASGGSSPSNSLYRQRFDQDLAQMCGPAPITATCPTSGSAGTLARARALAWDPAEIAVANDAAAQLRSWQQIDAQIVGLNEAGEPNEAIARATTAVPSASSAFDQLDTDLGDAIQRAQLDFDSSAIQGRDALSGLFVGSLILVAASVLVAVVGLARRLAEYL